jgi:DNA-directed RNA polymerase subunit RPC12/RpoP
MGEVEYRCPYCRSPNLDVDGLDRNGPYLVCTDCLEMFTRGQAIKLPLHFIGDEDDGWIDDACRDAAEKA